jgi:hypothetical protein
MLSLILYGRNDSYGYNLHKRAAISLNCMAEMLTSPGDEILFVDYNTPDDFPTFPEAIQDTLTSQAKKVLRILRVRPSQHEPFRHLTRLVALEPIARNVALRRSNPANRWILSTNTDMVFVPQRGETLSEVVGRLPDAYYPLPRFEVPETLWESADRLDPKGTIEAFGTWGRTFHLNEIVLGGDPTVHYDAPGDFQLVLRSDLWSMHGFHEAMLLGWHVDSNLAKRIALLPRVAGDILDDVLGYHCDHTRQVTPAHRHRAVENDLRVFFEDVTSAGIPEQAETWGLAGQTIEEISVNSTSRFYIDALAATTPAPLAGATPRVFYAHENHNLIDYSVDHVLPFLADALASYPRQTVLAWFGSKRSLLVRFAQVWRALGFASDILVGSTMVWLGPELPEGCVWTPEERAITESDILLFDWGRPEAVSPKRWDFNTSKEIKGVSLALRIAVREERRRLAKARDPRRFIGINAVANDAERPFHDLVGAARTPIATRIRQGYVNDLLELQDLLPALNCGGLGHKVAGGIVANSGEAGCIFYGPYLLLDSGTYNLRVKFDAEIEAPESFGKSGLVIELISNSSLLASRAITGDEVARHEFIFGFNVPSAIGDAMDWPETEFRLRTVGWANVTIERAVLEHPTAVTQDRLPSEFDFLPLLTVGRAGTYGALPAGAEHIFKDAGAPVIYSKPGIADFVAYGPHIWLLPGHYEATFSIYSRTSSERRGVIGRIEIIAAFGEDLYAEQFIDLYEPANASNGGWLHSGDTLHFDIQAEGGKFRDGLLECRIWSEGAEFAVVALDVRRTGDPGSAKPTVGRLFGGQLDPAREALARHLDRLSSVGGHAEDVLWLSQAGPAGTRVAQSIVARENVPGIVTQGPYLWLLPGAFEVTFEIRADDVAQLANDVRIEVASGLGCDLIAGHVFEPKDLVPNGRSVRFPLRFDIATDAPPIDTGLLEFRVLSAGTGAFEVAAIELRRVDASQSLSSPDIDPIRLENMLWWLRVGPNGRRVPGGIEAVAAEGEGAIAHGPYVSLPPGYYEAEFEVAAERAGRDAGATFDIATKQGNEILAAHAIPSLLWTGRRFERFFGKRRRSFRSTLEFEVPGDTRSDERGLLEFRVWGTNKPKIRLMAIRVRRLAAR